MIIQEDDLEFNFSDAIDAIKFDDQEHALAHCMKAVDFIVELSEVYIFVEVKDPSHPQALVHNDVAEFQEKTTSGKLREDLVKKFRDSFVYRWAEEKLEKPIHYLSLITIEEALLSNFQDDLQQHLPFSGPARWARPIVRSCHAINIEAWNRNFPKWPVRRLSEAT